MNEYVPRGFSWLIPGSIAALAFPDQPSDFEYLINNGIRHLISLTQEMKPEVEHFSKLTWTDVGIEDYGTFSLEQIQKIIQVCERALTQKEVNYLLRACRI
jgi:atypical dual specificity phosphatase